MKKKNKHYWFFIIFYIAVASLFYIFVLQPKYSKMLAFPQKEADLIMKEEKAFVPSVNIQDYIEKEASIDLFLLVDQSGSMKFTDPDNIRIKAADFIIKNMAEKSDENDAHRIGIVEFGTASPPERRIKLTEVSRINDGEAVYKTLRNRTHSNMGDTNFLAALKRTHEDMINSGSLSGEKRIKIIIFTDGEPDPYGESFRGESESSVKARIDKHFKELDSYIKNSFANIPFDLYIIVFDQNEKIYHFTQKGWKEIAGQNNVFLVKDIKELDKHYNVIMRRIFGMKEDLPAAVLSNTQREDSFSVPPYLSSVEFVMFTWLKDDEYELHIIDPKGKNVLEDPSVRQKRFAGGLIVTCKNPEPGSWRYNFVRGTGKVEIERNEIPIKFIVINPDPSRTYYPQGKSLRMQLAYQRQDGEPINEHPEYPIVITAEVFTPDGNSYPLKFNKNNQGILEADKEIDTGLMGVYDIDLRFTAGTGDYRYRQPMKISVVPIPYISFLYPQNGDFTPINEPLNVKMEILREGEPIDVKDYFRGHPVEYVTLKYKPSANAEPVVDRKGLELAEDSKGMYIYNNLPMDISSEGQYAIFAQFDAEPKDQETVMQKDSELVIFNAHKPAEDIAMIKKVISGRIWRYWLIVLFVFIILANIVFFCIMNSGKPMQAETAIIHCQGDKTEIELTGGFKSEKVSGKNIYFAFEKEDEDGNEMFSAALFHWFLIPLLSNIKIIKKTQRNQKKPPVDYQGLGIEIL